MATLRITGTGSQSVNGVEVVVTDATVTQPMQTGNMYRADLGSPNNPFNVVQFSLSQSGTNIGLNLPQSATIPGVNTFWDTVALNLRNAGATNVVVSGGIATFTTSATAAGDPGTTLTYSGQFFPTGHPPARPLGTVNVPVTYVGPEGEPGSPQIRTFTVNNTTNDSISFVTTSGLTFNVPANSMSAVMAGPDGSADESWSFAFDSAHLVPLVETTVSASGAATIAASVGNVPADGYFKVVINYPDGLPGNRYVGSIDNAINMADISFGIIEDANQVVIYGQKTSAGLGIGQFRVGFVDAGDDISLRQVRNRIVSVVAS